MSELLGFVFAMAVIVAFGYLDHQFAKRWNLGISKTNPVAERIVVISDTRSHEAAIQQRRLTAQQDPQPAGGARVYLAAVIEAYDEFAQIIAPDIELYPIDVYVEQARQYMIEAQ